MPLWQSALIIIGVILLLFMVLKLFKVSFKIIWKLLLNALIGGVVPATELDYATEFDDYILALRVVDSLDEAIEHIQKYTTGHSEAILTNDYTNAQAFTARVDAAAVYITAGLLCGMVSVWLEKREK